MIATYLNMKQFTKLPNKELAKMFKVHYEHNAFYIQKPNSRHKFGGFKTYEQLYLWCIANNLNVIAPEYSTIREWKRKGIYFIS